MKDFEKELTSFGFDKVYICPHQHNEGCSCRKPAIGMLIQAAKENNLDLKQCVVIGDRWTDLPSDGAATMWHDCFPWKNRISSLIHGSVKRGMGGYDSKSYYQQKGDFIVLDKKKVGNILGVTSLLPVIISIIIFYVERGPNADVYFVITIYGILSIIGILFAVFSWLMTKRFFLPIISLIGNGAVLAITFLLLLAMGISEP
jgi:hypothetical protein